jgi:hypothetical protein
MTSGIITGSEPLPPYNPMGACAKCGHHIASTTFMADGFCNHAGAESTVVRAHDANLGAGERLHRCCQRCGYAWDEACRDAPQDANQT